MKEVERTIWDKIKPQLRVTRANQENNEGKIAKA